MSSQSLPTQAQLDGALTGFGRDLGTGTAFPTQGPAASVLRRGDAYYHATYGALFAWTGTGWRSRGPGELTSAQRTALVTANIPYAGFQVYETDTKLTYQWTGAAWSVAPIFVGSGSWQNAAPGQSLKFAAGWGDVSFAAVSYAYLNIAYGATGFTAPPIITAVAADAGVNGPITVASAEGVARTTTQCTMTVRTAPPTNITATVRVHWMAMGI